MANKRRISEKKTYCTTNTLKRPSAFYSSEKMHFQSQMKTISTRLFAALLSKHTSLCRQLFQASFENSTITTQI